MIIKYTIGVLAKINLPIGICVCLVYPTNPNIVATAAFISFIAFLIDHFLTYTQHRKLEKLDYAEYVERSILRSIRNSLVLERPVTTELIESSIKASNEADSKYYETYSCNRPLQGIPVSSSQAASGFVP